MVILDVTEQVNVADGDAVYEAVASLMRHHYPAMDLAPLRRSFEHHAAIYDGRHPEYWPCDTGYHDKRHVLDVTLATARLISGYETAAAEREAPALGMTRALVGLIVALYHDFGYIRHREVDGAVPGAVFTKTHVSRSADFLTDWLPAVGLDAHVETARCLVHFTGYEIPPAEIPLTDPLWRQLGCLIGTADAMAQMASRDYLEKCRDDLFREFELGGVSVTQDAEGRERVVYASGEDLLRQTPDFMQRTLQERLDRAFHQGYRYMEYLFGGANPYMAAIQANRERLSRALREGDKNLLRQTS